MIKQVWVAQLFSKKLGEKFTVRSVFGEYKAYFDESGLMVENKDLWRADSSLVSLLTGEAVIIND